MSDMDIVPVGAVDVGMVASVALAPSDRGLDMVFRSESGQPLRIGMDWSDVADLMLRVAAFGQQISIMMQIGLDPYNAQHRQSFTLAELQACTDDPDGGVLHEE